MVLQCEWAQVQVILLANDGNGFGFGISGSRNSGTVVRNIFPGGAAERDGTLQNGDHLLAIGELRLWGMGAEQVAAVLRTAGQESIRLVVARPIDPTEQNFLINSVIVPTKVLSDPMELESTLQSNLLQQQQQVAAAVAAAAAAAVAAGESVSSNGFHFDPAMVSAAGNGESDAVPPDGHNVLSLSLSGESLTHNLPFPLPPPPPIVIGLQTVVTSCSSWSSQHATVSVVPSAAPAVTEEEDFVAQPPPYSSSPPSPTQSSSTTTVCEADVHCQEQQNHDDDGYGNVDDLELDLESASKEMLSARSSNSGGGGQQQKSWRASLSSSSSSVAEERRFPPPYAAEPKSVIVRHTQTSDKCQTETIMFGTIDENRGSAAAAAEHRTRKKYSSLKHSCPSSALRELCTVVDEGSSNSSSGGGGSRLVRKTSMPSSAMLHQRHSRPDENDIRSVEEVSGEGAATRPRKKASLSRKSSSQRSKRSHKNGKENDAHMLPEKEEHTIELLKGDSGLGITVAGYVCEKEDLCGIFVKSIISGSMADQCGKIMINDQITEVDGVALNGYNNQQAVEILKRTGHLVRLTIVRYLRGLKFEELKAGISMANMDAPQLAGNSFLVANAPKPGSGSVSTTLELPHQSPSPSPSSVETHCPKTTSSSSGGSGGGGSANRSRRRPSSKKSGGTTIDRVRSQEEEEQQPETAIGGSSFHSSSSAPTMIFLAQPATSFLAPPPSGPNLASSNGEERSSRKDEIVSRWERLLGTNFTVVVAVVRKPEGGSSSGLGISLEGTVDVEEGREVRPHHYIRSILPGGPVALDGVLASGDELLEVNGRCLRDLFHEDVVACLKRLPVEVSLVCCRRANGPSPIRCTIVESVDAGRSEEQAFASRKILSGSLQSLLAAKEPELLMKAKSEVSLLCTTSQSLSLELNGGGGSKSASTDERGEYCSSSNKKSSKCKSLEQLACGAMWSSFVHEVVLVKGEKGLGFSILDYQDPQKMSETVIVIRSLIPGGVAQHDQRLVPGDRLVYVNDTRLDNASLDAAVQALKGAAFGRVRLGIARPLSELDESLSSAAALATTYDYCCSTQEQSNISELRTDTLVQQQQQQQQDEDRTTPTQSLASGQGDNTSDLKPSRQHLEPVRNIPILPHLPKFSIVVNKASYEGLGLQLEALAYELCGTLIRGIDPSAAVGRDDRLRVGDLVLYLNHESMWRVTSSQTKIILRRAEFVTTGIPIIFIPEEHLNVGGSSSSSSSEVDLSAATATDPVASLSESLKLSEIREEDMPDDPNFSS